MGQVQVKARVDPGGIRVVTPKTLRVSFDSPNGNSFRARAQQNCNHLNV